MIQVLGSKQGKKTRAFKLMALKRGTALTIIQLTL